MKHRIHYCDDIQTRLAQLSEELTRPEVELNQALDCLISRGIAFKEPYGKTTGLSLSVFNELGKIAEPLPALLYARFRQDIPCKLLPHYGFNWATLIDRMRRLWEQSYNILITKLPSHHLRLAWLRLGGAKIGKDSSVWRNTEVLGIENLVIGNDSVVGWHCLLDARGGLVIGDHVAIASYVLIIGGGHDLEAPEFWSISSSIRIEDYAWIASRALIGRGAHIGRGAVVVANSVVSKPVAPYKIVGGSGAKPMGERPHQLCYKVGARGLFNLLH